MSNMTAGYQVRRKMVLPDDEPESSHSHNGSGHRQKMAAGSARAGAEHRIRTDDPRFTKALLYQLS